MACICKLSILLQPFTGEPGCILAFRVLMIGREFVHTKTFWRHSMKLFFAATALLISSVSFGSDIYMRAGDSLTLGSDRVFCEAGNSSSQFTCECRLIGIPEGIGCAMKGYQGIKVRYVDGQRQEQALVSPSALFHDCYTSSDPEGSERRLLENHAKCRSKVESHPACQF